LQVPEEGVDKIYTKGGDKGETSLFGGERVSKNDPLVNTYGTIDELNSLLGVARSLHDRPDRITEILHYLQCELFELGADLAARRTGKGRITESRVTRLEEYIDDLTYALPELQNFILPTGHPVAAHLHQARTVCRRAERLAVAVKNRAELDDVVIRYLNRLSDLLFVLARTANKSHNIRDEEWHPTDNL
jgi:cob(I)alamin adenosyltransferase